MMYLNCAVASKRRSSMKHVDKEVKKGKGKIVIQSLEDKSTGDTGNTNRSKMRAVERDMNLYFKH